VYFAPERFAMSAPENRVRTGQFRPGQSGNPGGRPRVIAEVRELAREHTETALATLAEISENKKLSPSARVAAATALLDRGYGKPTQPLDHELKNDHRPAREKTTAELDADVLPFAKAFVRRLVGDAVDSMDKNEIIERAVVVWRCSGAGTDALESGNP
jgi:hypothetical protein